VGVDVHWRLNRTQLREEAQFDGLYCLLTNLSAATAPLRTVFHHYKEQSLVEGRFRAVKQPPLQVCPLGLHQPQRIESLVFVVMVALFLFALIEREARRVVQQSGQVFTGLRPEGRDHLPVTSAQVVEGEGFREAAGQSDRAGPRCARAPHEPLGASCDWARRGVALAGRRHGYCLAGPWQGRGTAWHRQG
jgi:hypothetical protein